MKKQITKLTKAQKAKIENRLLSVFATALGGIMLLTYIYNYLNGSKGYKQTAEIIVYVAIAAFLFLAVFLKIKATKATKENQLEKAAKCNNWFWTSIAGLVVSLLTYPDTIFEKILPTETYFKFMANYWKHPALCIINQDATDTRIVFLMALIALYTLCVFIFYGIYTVRAHKSSLNKGSKKK